jgi:signal transduction histidine kinase
MLDVTEEIAQVFKLPLEQKNIALAIEMQEGQTVLADENHVKMILRNLVSNAVKFTEPAGTITLYAQTRGTKLMINVKDTGRGMTADEISKLFSTQTHFTMPGTKGEKGTGIGLLLCRQLAELNGGELGVTSVPDQGSTFYFTLPIADYHMS